MIVSRYCRINKISPVRGAKIEDGVKFVPNSRQPLICPAEPVSHFLFNKTVK
jgi:hypothetical protein